MLASCNILWISGAEANSMDMGLMQKFIERAEHDRNGHVYWMNTDTPLLHTSHGIMWYTNTKKGDFKGKSIIILDSKIVYYLFIDSRHRKEVFNEKVRTYTYMTKASRKTHTKNNSTTQPSLDSNFSYFNQAQPLSHSFSQSE